MIAFIDDYRAIYGVEPITPFTSYRHAGRRSDPQQWPARARRDAELKGLFGHLWRRVLVS
ncbi:hypothetical protein [Mycetohabitans rhizoxinica]|uniref:Transposase n=1 Tax=Mycetohabitans rhizoxinica TaxID=412963 RepID=A0ABZ2Q7A9_9BURK